MKLSVIHNTEKNGIEFHFTDSLSDALELHLLKIGFKQAFHTTDKWYVTYHPAYWNYLMSLQETLLRGFEWNTATIAPSFEKSFENIENKKFSIATFHLTNALQQEYIIFDSYKRVATVIAEAYGAKYYKNELLHIDVVSRTRKERARNLLKEGRVIKGAFSLAETISHQTVSIPLSQDERLKKRAEDNAKLEEGLKEHSKLRNFLGDIIDEILTLEELYPNNIAKSTQNVLVFLEMAVDDDELTIKSAILKLVYRKIKAFLRNIRDIKIEPFEIDNCELFIEIYEEGMELCILDLKDDDVFTDVCIADYHNMKNDYIYSIFSHMHSAYNNRKLLSKEEIERIKNDIKTPNMRSLWEAVELSAVAWVKRIYNEDIAFGYRLARILEFWNSFMPRYDCIDDADYMLLRYPIPLPLAAILADYCDMQSATSVLSVNARNGQLALGANEKVVHANEIDPIYHDCIKYSDFKDATINHLGFMEDLEYYGTYDTVLVNPPTTNIEISNQEKRKMFNTYFSDIHLSSAMHIEWLTAIIALLKMKDDGKAILILRGHLYFDEQGRIAKNRPIYNWLYHHYNVDDVINIGEFTKPEHCIHYNKLNIILINGKKTKPEGTCPNREQAPHLETIEEDYQKIWRRICVYREVTMQTVIHQLEIAVRGN